MPGAEHNADSSPQQAVGPRSGLHCVYLTCFEDRTRFLTAMLAQAGIRLHRADTLDEADFLITATGSTVVLSDTAFLDGSWQHATEMVSQRHAPLAMLVLAERIDAESLAMAEWRGVFRICWKPLDVADLRSAIEIAHDATLDRQAEYRLYEAAKGSPLK